jgi:ABC-type transport system involved in cytochrome c biogenesis permease component
MATAAASLALKQVPAKDELVLPAFTLWWREVVRFYRQRARVVGVIASPVLFWFVIGSGFGRSFRSGGVGGQQYLDYFYPGALIMIVLFTSIFTMMSVIEDRKEGFLLSVLVAPVSRSAIVLGKVLGGTTLSTIQGLIFLIFAPLLGIHVPADRARRFSGVVRPDRSGICNRLANGLDASLPCHYQSLSDSLVASLWGAVPALRRLPLVAHANADQSFDVWGGGVTAAVLSRHRRRVISRGIHGNPGSVLIFYVRAGISDGKPADHQAGSVE